MTLWHETLKQLIALVDKELALHTASVGEFDSKNYDAWRSRRQVADSELMIFFTNEHGAVFTEQAAHSHTVRMAGIRSSSTSGWSGALQNWRTAARKKIEAA